MRGGLGASPWSATAALRYTPRSGRCRCARNPARAHAFTLIELLVVIAIIAILLSILVPAVSAVRQSTRSLVCGANMRSVAVELQMFAEGESHAGRGDSETLGRNYFWINDFQESLYQIDEFWDQGGRQTAQIDRADSLMLCPSSVPSLTKNRGFPCSTSAIGPVEDVSIGFNMRLYRGEIQFGFQRILAPVMSTRVRADVTYNPYVPLAFDIDGAAAASRGVAPFYSAPPLPEMPIGPYASGQYWFPSMRHRGGVNVAFVGGHVLRSSTPGAENWDWSYQADVH